MEIYEPVSSAPEAKYGARTRHWLGVAVEAVDWRLRRRLGVSEYTRSSDCILRMQIIRNTDHLRLIDGTCLRPGDRIIDLHFWNQQVPLMSRTGATLGWARRMNEGFGRSLHELAHHLAARADVDDIVAIRAVAALGAEARGDKISRILSRFGFDIVVQRDAPSIMKQIRRLGENILISFIVLAYNPRALRPDTLSRDRVYGYLSRSMLDQRYRTAKSKDARQLTIRCRPHGNSTSQGSRECHSAQSPVSY
jgi:hypothetical protein